MDIILVGEWCIWPLWVKRDIKPCLSILQGTLCPKQSSLTHTLASRLRLLWQHVRDSLEAFENAPDRGKNGIFRADSRFAPNQWETALLCNDVSNWLGASLESVLDICSSSGIKSIFTNVSVCCIWVTPMKFMHFISFMLAYPMLTYQQCRPMIFI